LLFDVNYHCDVILTHSFATHNLDFEYYKHLQ